MSTSNRVVKASIQVNELRVEPTTRPRSWKSTRMKPWQGEIQGSWTLKSKFGIASFVAAFSGSQTDRDVGSNRGRRCVFVVPAHRTLPPDRQTLRPKMLRMPNAQLTRAVGPLRTRALLDDRTMTPQCRHGGVVRQSRRDEAKSKGEQ